MAGTAELFAAIAQKPGVTYSALVPNERGMQDAIASGVKTVAVFLAASESFSQKNINCSITESFARIEPVMKMAADHGIAVRGYVSCVMGCPFEGAIDPARVADVAGQLHRMGCYEISLGDTIGIGDPAQTKRLVEIVSRVVPTEKLAIHCHDTYGRALANIFAAMEMGIAAIDASAGGIGGCPYAKRADQSPDMAAGNVAMEDVLDLLTHMGIETGIDAAVIRRAAWDINRVLGRKPNSRLAFVSV
jgi:hydroxymethylglutaryl-CoA lyase